MTGPSTCANTCALGGTRTPNLLIHSLVLVVQGVRWGSIVQVRVHHLSGEHDRVRFRLTSP